MRCGDNGKQPHLGPGDRFASGIEQPARDGEEVPRIELAQPDFERFELLVGAGDHPVEPLLAITLRRNLQSNRRSGRLAAELESTVGPDLKLAILREPCVELRPGLVCSAERTFQSNPAGNNRLAVGVVDDAPLDDGSRIQRHRDFGAAVERQRNVDERDKSRDLVDREQAPQ